MSSCNIPGRARAAAPLILLALLLAFYWCTPGFLVVCEQKVQDLLLKRLLIQRSESPTRLILTDERRSVSDVAKIIGVVAQGKPRAIGLCDCLRGPDAVLETAVRGAEKAVIGYRFAFDGRDAAPKNLLAVEKSRIRFVTNPWGKSRRPAAAPRLTLECANARAIGAAAGCGFSNINPDADGIVRGVPLVGWAKNDIPYQGLPVALLAVSLGADRVTLRLKGEAVQGIDIGGLRISTDSKGRLLLREYTEEATCSASDLLEGKLHPRAFSGKIVLIGSNSRRFRTRISSSVPEAVIQATAIENALRGDYLRRSRGMAFFEIALMLGIPLTISRLRGWRRWGALLGAMVFIAGCAVILLACCRQEMRILFPAASIILAWMAPVARARS